MPQAKLPAAVAIKSIKLPETGQVDYRDVATPGLFLRVSAKSKVWAIRLRTPRGTQERHTLGEFTDHHGLAWARKEADALRHRVQQQGVDPREQRKALKVAHEAKKEKDRLTLGVLVGEWSKARVELNSRTPRYVAEAARALKVAFAGQWDAPAAALDWETVAQVLNQRTPVMAARTMNYGRACYGWALKARKGSLSTNPFLGHDVVAAVQRDRVLDDAELAEVWHASLLDPGVYGGIVRLLILTGQREMEIACMAWPELSADGGTWTIPKERAKNKKAHIVPLSAPAQAELPAARDSSLVFPGEGERHPHFQAWSRAKARLDAAITTARAKAAKEAGTEPQPMPGWRLHDLRRTCATGLQRLGVRSEVTEAVLNHTSGTRRGIVGIYQRHHWTDEKKAALDAWAAHVADLVTGTEKGSNVVTLARVA